ncbi:MAG TPA: hypothetical protein VJM14_07905, partial [Burkholderiales bacterium]|nr:hypothetical protein [Burkholderiales bacterium]
MPGRFERARHRVELDRLGWPLAEHFDVSAESGAPSNGFLLELMDGRSIVGEVERFLLAETVLEFRADYAATSHVVPFSEIKSLRLRQPLVLKPHKSLAGLKLEGALGDRDFLVTFVGGTTLGGRARAVMEDRHGLFIYHLYDGGKVFAVFVPRSAVTAERIGARLGQVLVAKE